ncbi:hypothetical protein LINGRAHAP2_LOCUS22728 [Linum grandiflorum]
MRYTMLDEIATKSGNGVYKVWVSRSWTAINIKYNSIMYRDFVFIDEKGNKIWAQIPQRYMGVFADILGDQKVYILQNFKLINAPKTFCPCDNQWAIEFTPTTVVEEVETTTSIPQYKFNFIPAIELPKSITKRDVLWDTIGYVEEYKKPDNARPHSIHKLIHLRVDKADEDKLPITRPIYSDPSDVAMSSLVTLDALNEAIRDDANKVEDGVDSYLYCKIIRKETKKRFRIQLEVQDGTGEAYLIILDSLGEAMLGTTANDLYASSDTDSRNPPSLITRLVDTEIKVQVHVNAFNISTVQNSFTITKIISSPTIGTQSTAQVPPFTVGNTSSQSDITEPQTTNIRSDDGAASCTTNFTVASPTVGTPSTPKEMISASSSISGPESSTLKSAASTTRKSKVTPVKFNDSLEDEVSEDNIPLCTIKKDLKRKQTA